MNWNFGRWVAGMSWPGVVAWMVHYLHKWHQHGPPWEAFNWIGGGP